MEPAIEWIELKNIEDIDNLMNVFGKFHDFCLKELHLWTDHYVESNLAMNISPNLDCKVRILFQRQSLHPSAIEVLFEEVAGLNIVPSSENYDSIIFEATMILENGIFYWAEDSDWSIGDKDKLNSSWISAKKVKWRDASDWMGNELRYGPKVDIES